MKPNAPCLVLGYPGQEKQPLVRRTQVVDSPDTLWSCRLYTSPSSLLGGGDSGGGVFDLEGRVVATNIGGGWGPGSDHARIELHRTQWDSLAAGRPVGVTSTDPLAEINAAFRHVAGALPPFVVQVLRDGSPCALGTVVRGDRRILTKASEVYRSVSCRLPDGQVVLATLEKESREHDLALLKVEAKNLPAAEWSAGEGALPGSLIAALVPGQAPSVNVVSLPTRSIAPESGWLGVNVEDSDRGLVVGDDSFARWFEVPLRKGDIILHIEGRREPNRAAYVELTEAKAGNALAGDPVRVGVSRLGKTLEFRFPLAPTTGSLPANPKDYESRRDPDLAHVSLRRSGFPSVFDTAISLTPAQCGGPLIDLRGRVVGIAIACSRRGGETPAQIHAIPAAVARRFVTD
jgi:serine protease Do